MMGKLVIIAICAPPRFSSCSYIDVKQGKFISQATQQQNFHQNEKRKKAFKKVHPTYKMIRINIAIYTA